MPSYNSTAELGSFVSNTQTQNVSATLNQMSLVLNTKDTGYYPLTEFVCGQLYFPDPTLTSASTTTPVWRQVFRKVINFGALPNTATKTVAHGITITATTSFTRIYGVATDPSTSFLPLPYSSATANDVIEVWVDATNVNIKVGKDRSGYTTCYVVLEYLKF
jgi:hypothetical protein